MSDVFHSARLTFDRAQYHIRDFNSVIRSFIDNRPWTEFIDKDFEPGKEIHKVGFTTELPETLPCVLFDAANNLRAVLHQSGYAAALASGNVNPTKCLFPFGDTLAEIQAHIAGRKTGRDLPPDILNLFLSFKPYKGPDSTLLALNKLCNAKKHRALIPLEISEPTINFQASVPEGTKIGYSVDADGTVRGWNPDKREMTLVTVQAGLNPHITGRIDFEIAIEGIQALSRLPATKVLKDMSGIVQSVLMATEAECRRLGFIA